MFLHVITASNSSSGL